MSDKTGKLQETRFKKGQSGNPNGRPKGSLNNMTLAMQELLDGEGLAITRKAIDLALEGDMQALKLCLDRLLPAKKERHFEITLPGISSESDLPLFVGALLKAVTAGEISLSEARDLRELATSYKICLNNEALRLEWPI